MFDETFKAARIPARASLWMLAAVAALLALAVPQASAESWQGPEVTHDTSPPLSSIPPKPAGRGKSFPARRKNSTNADIALSPKDRHRLQTQLGPGTAPSTASNWEGVNNVDGVLPPDTNGDVGPNDYVQWVNLSFQIWDKKTATKFYASPAAGNTLWSGFGTGTPASVCATTNQGDPVVLYDRLAGRWFFSQFAFNVDRAGNPVAPFYQCMAVSTTGDPRGSYYRYGFEVNAPAHTGYFPDYPKFGVWPDAYYMSANNFNGNTFAGAAGYAFDRSKMLNGQAATFKAFQLPSQYEGLIPSNFTGTQQPPAGSPNYFGAVDTSSATGTGSTFQIWKFHADFATPANATFTGPTNVPVNTYKYSFCGQTYSSACIPQPGTTRKLDPLADRLMNRLQYRNFGDHETLIASHTVNAGVGSDQAGMRWYEIRAPGSATPDVHQQDTFAPADGVNRWMGSAAMDSNGNMALGYSASNGSSVFPSVRYTGRLASDPLNQMTQGEGSLVAGAGSENGSYSRWGDYSAMSVDPSDDQTFWYTQEYYQASSAVGWQTRIGSFKLAPTVSTTPQGNWVGTYGSAGYSLGGWNGSGGDLGYLPNASVTLAQGSRYVWSGNTSDVRALQSPDQLVRRATTYYDPNQIHLQLNFSSAYSGNLHLYAVDWDTTARRETVTVNGQSASLSGDFSQGAWVSVPVNVASGGSVSITVDRNAGANAVLSGIFLGDAGTPPAIPTPSSPQGNWVGAFGSAGYALGGWTGSGDVAYLPNATLTLGQGSRYAWDSNSGDVRALKSPDQAVRRATAYYDANQVQLQLKFSSAYSGNLHLYAVDWDTTARRETITVNGQSAVLSGDFSQGAWVAIPVSVAAGGSATITVDRTAGPNAVLSGVFLGDAGAPPALPVSSSPQGNWVGTFGSAGYDIGAWNGTSDLTSLPNASASLAQGFRYVWDANSSDARALQSPDQSTRRATTFYDGNQVRVQLSFNAAYSGTLHLYAVDWDTTTRRETITVDGRTAILSGDFSQGAWAAVPINVASGDSVTITVDRTAGANAILSGLFLS